MNISEFSVDIQKQIDNVEEKSVVVAHVEYSELGHFLQFVTSENMCSVQWKRPVKPLVL